MNVLHNDLMFPVLSRPYPVQILQTQHFLLDAEANEFVQFFHVLRLVEVVTEHDGQDIVLSYPGLQGEDD